MKEVYIDYPYAVEFMERLHKLTVNAKPLSNAYFYGGYNLAEVCEQMIFEDVKKFSKTKTFTTKQDSLIIGIKILIVRVCMVLYLPLSLSYARLTNKRTLVYSMDRISSSTYQNDFRLEGLYEFLFTKKVPYVELFHTTPQLGIFGRLFTRGRVGLFLESIDSLLFLFGPVLGVTPKVRDLATIDFSSFEPFEREFAKHCVRRMLQRVSFFPRKVALLTLVLKVLRTKVVFAIDEYRYYHELMLSAKELDIHYYSLQHGHITKYQRGFLKQPIFEGKSITPFRALVWSEYWKEELARLDSLFKEESVMVSGYKEVLQDNALIVKEKSDQVQVLIPYETDAPKGEVTAWILHVLECPTVSVMFKTRADMEDIVQLREYDLHNFSHPRFRVLSNTKEAFLKADVVCGVYSTFLYDAVLKGLPVAIIKTSSDYGEGMYKNDLATLVTADISCSTLIEISNTPKEELEKHRNRLLPLEAKSLLQALTTIGETEGLFKA